MTLYSYHSYVTEALDRTSTSLILNSIWTPPTERIRGGGGNTPSTPSTGSGSQGVDNPRANAKLVGRWASSGLNTVAALKDHWTGSGDYTTPKDGSTDICLKYQLVKKCKAGCHRKATHKVYGADTINAIHEHLTKCGVPNGP